MRTPRNITSWGSLQDQNAGSILIMSGQEKRLVRVAFIIFLLACLRVCLLFFLQARSLPLATATRSFRPVVTRYCRAFQQNVSPRRKRPKPATHPPTRSPPITRSSQHNFPNKFCFYNNIKITKVGNTITFIFLLFQLRRNLSDISNPVDDDTAGLPAFATLDPPTSARQSGTSTLSTNRPNKTRSNDDDLMASMSERQNRLVDIQKEIVDGLRMKKVTEREGYATWIYSVIKNFYNIFFS